MANKLILFHNGVPNVLCTIKMHSPNQPSPIIM